MNKLRSYWIFLACFFQALPSLLATTYVGQAIVVPTTWTKEGSPYMITEDVTISEGITLTIEEGCAVYFSQETQFIVAGGIAATGSVAQPIVFEGWNATNWKGFLFLKECNDYQPSTKKGVKFEHCIFKGSQEATAPLLRSKGCNILLQCCQIDDCYTAIQTERQAELWLEHSIVKNCNRALNIRNTSLAHVQHNKFLNCNSILLGGTTVFEYNTLKRFTSEGRHSGLIVWMLGGGKVTIRYNQFQKFEDYVIKLYKLTQRSSVVLEYNDFKNNPVNLKLCCQYYNVGKVLIQQNNFHNFRRYQVQIYGRCEEEDNSGLAIGRNYWGKLTLLELQTATIDHSDNSDMGLQVQYAKPLEKAVKVD